MIDAIPLIIEAGIKLIISLVQALPQIITTIVAAIPKIISGLIDAIVGNIDKIIMAGVQLLIALVQNTPKIIIEVVKAIPQIIKGLIDAIIGFVPKIAETGLTLIKGLWEGISNAAQWIKDKIAGFMSNILGGIKSFFGIKSPSTVFRDQIGKNMALGLGVGFEDEMDAVAKDMQDAIPTSLDAPDFDLNAGIHTALDGAGAAVSIADIGIKLDGIASLMAQMFPALLEALNIKVVLNDGTLVGRLAPEIDRNLALLRKRNLGVV